MKMQRELHLNNFIWLIWLYTYYTQNITNILHIIFIYMIVLNNNMKHTKIHGSIFLQGKKASFTAMQDCCETQLSFESFIAFVACWNKAMWIHSDMI